MMMFILLWGVRVSYLTRDRFYALGMILHYLPICAIFWQYSVAIVGKVYCLILYQGSYRVLKFQDLLEKSWNLKIVKKSPGVLLHFEKVLKFSQNMKKVLEKSSIIKYLLGFKKKKLFSYDRGIWKIVCDNDLACNK